MAVITSSMLLLFSSQNSRPPHQVRETLSSELVPACSWLYPIWRYSEKSRGITATEFPLAGGVEVQYVAIRSESSGCSHGHMIKQPRQRIDLFIDLARICSLQVLAQFASDDGDVRCSGVGPQLLHDV